MTNQTIQSKINELTVQKNKMQKYREELEKQGYTDRLVCKNGKGYPEFYINNKYLGKRKHRKYINALSTRDCINKMFPIMDEAINRLSMADDIDRFLDENYNAINIGKRSFSTPVHVTVQEKINKFINETYEPLDFAFDNNRTNYYTDKKEKVRSKSEIIIANKLKEYGIPYHYEKPLTLQNNGYTETIYPDFTAINIRTGEIIYIEHLGMMDSDRYVARTIHKLDIYEQNGILLGKNLILLHETSSATLNTKVVDDYIMCYLL